MLAGRGNSSCYCWTVLNAPRLARSGIFDCMLKPGWANQGFCMSSERLCPTRMSIFQEGKCLSYSRGVAYHPVIDIVKSNFDIKEGDGDLEIREKLKRGLSIIGVDEVSTLPYFWNFYRLKTAVSTRSL